MSLWEGFCSRNSPLLRLLKRYSHANYVTTKYNRCNTKIFAFIAVLVFAPAASASERGGILALPHERDAEIFSQLIVFFFSKENFLTQLNTYVIVLS